MQFTLLWQVCHKFWITSSQKLLFAIKIDQNTVNFVFFGRHLFSEFRKIIIFPKLNVSEINTGCPKTRDTICFWNNFWKTWGNSFIFTNHKLDSSRIFLTPSLSNSVGYILRYDVLNFKMIFANFSTVKKSKFQKLV